MPADDRSTPHHSPFDELVTQTPRSRVAQLHANRERLITAPTPLERLDRLRDALGGGPRIWIKRDDLTGFALGGNKARKLEYLVAQARQEGADTLITVGAAQSNHARQTAAAAAKAGLGSTLVVRVPQGASVEYRTSGNVLLDRLFGAELVLVDETDADPHPERATANQVAARLREEGRRPFLIPSGGSTAIGALGYVNAYAELAQQAADARVEFSQIVVASGSGGTQAGILAGRALLAGASPGIRGVAVAPGAAELAEDIAVLTRDTLALFGEAATVDVELDPDHVGEAYGALSDDGVEALDLFARTEGILLDPVYTAKAAAALLASIRSGAIDADADVLFWHTGGTPALFAHATALTERSTR
jgi:D-cysteine desulfhydrase/L-cysteate sulfo-lyase